PHGLLLLGVDRYDRVIGGQEGLGLRINVLKLRVAIDVLAAFSGLAVGLQAIAHSAQKSANNRKANLVPPTPSPDYAGCERSTTPAASGRPALRTRPDL